MIWCFGLALTGEFDALVREARAAAAAHKTRRSNGPSFLEKGPHRIKGLSFNLAQNVMNSDTNSVRGLAISSDRRFIAVVSNSNIGENVFADSTTQAFYKLKEAERMDRETSVYEMTKIPYSHLFQDVKMFTAPDAEYSCSFDDKSLISSICKASVGYNWPEPEEDENPLDLDPVEQAAPSDLFNYKVGAFMQSYGAVAVSLKGFTNLRVDYDFEFSAAGGYGIFLNKNLTDESIALGETCTTMYGYDLKILGIDVSFAIKGCVDLGVKGITVNIPEHLEFYRKATLRAKKSGYISSVGSDIEPFEYEVTTQSDSNVNTGEAFDFDKDYKFSISPSTAMYMKIDVQFGSYIDSKIKIGTEYSIQWNFKPNNKLCTCPYLYGHSISTLNGFIQSSPITVNGFELVPALQYDIPLFKSKPSINHCLFDADNSKEGNIDYSSTPAAAIVIRPTQANLMYQSSGHSEYSLKLSDYSSIHETKPFSTQQLETIVFTKETDQIPLNRIHVITDPKAEQRMKFSAVKYNTIFDNVFDFDDYFSPHDFGIRTLCGNTGSKQICIDTDVEKAVKVEPFKEFQVNETEYVAIDKLIPPGTVLALLEHGDYEQYQVNEESQIFDDTITDTSQVQKGFYKVEDTLDVSFNSFSFTYGQSSGSFHSVMWFYSCDDENVCQAIGHLDLPKTYRNKMMTSADLGIEDWSIPFDKKHDMKITFTTDTFLWGTREEFTIEASLFNHSEPVAVGVSTDKFSLALNIRRHNSVIMFKGSSQEFKGIVCPVYQIEDTITLNQVKEKYIVLRPTQSFKGTKVLIEAKNVLPLSRHEILDANHFIIDAHSTIPLRLQNASIELKIIKAFNAGSSIFCGSNSHFQDKEGLVGCINTQSTRFTAYKDKNVANIDLYKPKSGQFELLTFDGNSIQQTSFAIKENVSRLYIPSTTFTKEFRDKISVHCEKCGGMKLIRDNKASVTRESKVFEYVNENNEDLMFVSLCSDEKDAFCENEGNFKGVMLVEYGNNNGVIDTSFNGAGTPLMSSVKRQMVYGRSKVTYIKDWDGSINRIANFTDKSSLHFEILPTNNEVIITPKVNNIVLPMNSQFYQTHPEEFIRTFVKSEIKPGDVNMSTNGVLKIRKGIFKYPSMGVSESWNNSLLGIFPPDLVSDTIIECAPGLIFRSGACLKDNRSTKVAVGISVGVGFIIIAMMVLIIFFTRRKAVHMDSLDGSSLIKDQDEIDGETL